MALMAQALVLYVLVRRDHTLFLAPGPTGFPEPADDAVPTQAQYLEDGPDLDQRIAVVAGRFHERTAHLLVPLTCPDGHPHRSVVVFSRSRDLPNQRVIVDRQTRRAMTVPVSRFAATGPAFGGPWGWETDIQQGRPGFFLTGPGGHGSLFRVVRAEVDAIGRTVLTLSPVRLATGLPRADFSGIKDPVVRAEVEGAFRELGSALAGYQTRSVVTRAKDVVEGILGSLLREHGLPVGRDLSDRLRTVREEMEKPGGSTLGLTRLEYHLAQKIRLLHGRTHPPAPGQPPRPLGPELALTVVEDLGQILRQLEMAR